MKKMLVSMMIVSCLLFFASCEDPEIQINAEDQLLVMLNHNNWETDEEIAYVRWTMHEDIPGAEVIEGRADAAGTPVEKIAIAMGIIHGPVKNGVVWHIEAYDEKDHIIACREGKSMRKPGELSVFIDRDFASSVDMRIIKLYSKERAGILAYKSLTEYLLTINDEPVGTVPISGEGKTLLFSYIYDGKTEFTYSLFPRKGERGLPGGCEGTITIKDGEDRYFISADPKWGEEISPEPEPKPDPKPDPKPEPKPDPGPVSVNVKVDLAFENPAKCGYTLKIGLSGQYQYSYRRSDARGTLLDLEWKEGDEYTYELSLTGLYEHENGETYELDLLPVISGSFKMEGEPHDITLGKVTEVHPVELPIDFYVSDADWKGKNFTDYRIKITCPEYVIQKTTLISRERKNERGEIFLGQYYVPYGKNIEVDLEAYDRNAQKPVGHCILTVPGTDGGFTSPVNCKLTHPYEDEVTDEGWTLQNREGKWYILGYTGEARPSDLTVPADIGGRKIYGVWKLVVYDELQSLTLEDGIETVGEIGFNNYNHLNTINLPSTLKSFVSKEEMCKEGDINFGTFMNNGALETVNAPGTSITAIPENAFCGCGKLTTLNMPLDNVTSIGAGAFLGCGKLTLDQIPPLTETIGEGAFNSCTITTFELPDSLRVIDNEAFYSAKFSETYVDLKNVKEIGSKILPASVQKVRIPKDLTTKKITNSGPFGDRYGSELEVIFEEGRTEIPAYLFRYVLLASQFSIPDTVTAIGDYAFQGASLKGTEPLIIPESVTTIGCQAFNKFSGQINLPGNLEKIGSEAFFGMKQEIAEITVTGSVQEIGTHAFDSNIKKITFENKTRDEVNRSDWIKWPYSGEIVCSDSDQWRKVTLTYDKADHPEAYSLLLTFLNEAYNSGGESQRIYFTEGKASFTVEAKIGLPLEVSYKIFNSEWGAPPIYEGRASFDVTAESSSFELKPDWTAAE